MVITTVQTYQLGGAVSSRPHTILAQIPTWNDMVGFGRGETSILEAMNYGYPRSILHPDVRALCIEVEKKLRSKYDQHSILLFSSLSSASDCKEYILSLERNAIKPNSIILYSIEFTPMCHDRRLPIYAIIYPTMASTSARAFWQRTGSGISSRLAKTCLHYLDQIKITLLNEAAPIVHPLPLPHPVYDILRSRIAILVERTPAHPPQDKKLTPSDVFLYPSGMSAIYHAQKLLLDWREQQSVRVGFLYEATVKVLETFGLGSLHFNTLGQLEAKLESMVHAGTIQAIWCECPSNPLLWTEDFQRLRKLADKYHLVLVVDDSIANFANVNLLGVADVVVTSLSKTFSGYADVMAGSVILNPNSIHYPHIHKHLTTSYENNLYIEDAVQLELNSRDFLCRAGKINSTAQCLVDHLSPLTSDPASPLTQIYYPSLCPSRNNYEWLLRPATPEFTPGFGGLLTIDFENVPSAAAFFDNFHVAKGFSFGADVTIASPYVQMVMQKEKNWAARNGLNETIIRISVGLEDRDELLGKIMAGMEAASRVAKDENSLQVVS